MFVSDYIQNTYGSKRGLLNALGYFIKSLFGFYGHYKKHPITPETRFVFICSGNICRSPLAEYVAKQQGAKAISFGLHTRGGDPADIRAIAFAQTQGIDLRPHRTAHIKEYRPEPNDLLVCMEPKQAQELEQLVTVQAPITLAGFWLKKPQAYIHDPYSCNATFFNVCEQQVAAATVNLVARTK